MASHGKKLPGRCGRTPTRIDGVDRLTPAARAHLIEQQLDEGRAARVLSIAFDMACAEVEPVHIDLGIVIEQRRREADLTSAA